jgi:Arc/MetJ-type ribon-helix-helix transcriptional regulator
MKSKTKNIGLKIDDELREKIQIKVEEMGFKGTSEFVRYAINKALNEDARHQFLVEKLEKLTHESTKYYSENSKLNIEVSKKIYEKTSQVEALMKQVLETLSALSEE